MYVPLNIRTDYSLLYSLIRIKDLVKFAKENNLKSLTITDDNMFGAMEFYNECINNNIKPIIGLNIKIDDLSIILYAKNYDGYVNLLKISTIYRENKLNLEYLEKYKGNLICIIPYETRSLYKKLENIYSNIYVSYKDDIEQNKIKLKNKLYMKEILVINKDDLKYLNYLEAIKENKLLKDNIYDNYLDIKDIDNSYICDMCNLKISKNDNLLPKFETPNNNSYEYLKVMCKNGLKKRFGDKVNIKYIERLKYEISVINDMGFNDYFLIVSDYIKFAKSNNILVGPGRGSAVGSLVSYVLEITDIDPLKYDLLFERFLNKNRITMPDIDVDFEDSRREEVINYCIQKYGSKSVSGIITFVTLGSKQALKDIARVLDININEVEYLIKLLDDNLTLKDNLSNERIKNHLNKNEELKELYEIAINFEGLKKTTSVNASGIIMTNKELDNYVPLEIHDNMYLSGYAMNYLEDIGLLKMDFLALKNLTTISKITKRLNIDLNDIPLNDKKTLEIFDASNTLGIFQFETDGMMNVLKKFPIDSFDDIYNLSALFRPGPSKNIDSYIRRKKGIEKIDYLDSTLVDILKPTYGIIIFQEQIMQIANVMADYTLGEADILRRAMSKKKEDILIKEKDKFILRAIKKGYEKQLVEKVYDLILKFAEYGFNKSHSVAYAMISYQMAYLKAHYPNEFYQTLLSQVNGSIKSTSNFINDCKRNSVKLINPNINKSTNEYIVDDGILLPLTSIKGINYNVCKHILEVRKDGFQDIYDFLVKTDNKIITREIIINLVLAGCFNENKKTIIENIDIILNYTDLFREFGSDYALMPDLIEYKEYNKKEIIKKEFEIYGYYLNNNPLIEYRKENNVEKTLSNLSQFFNKTSTFILIVEEYKEILNKNKEKMAFIKFSDEFTNVDGVIFNDSYNDINIKQNDIVKVIGKVSRRNGKDQIIVNKIELLD